MKKLRVKRKESKSDIQNDCNLMLCSFMEMNPLMCGINLFLMIHSIRDVGLQLSSWFRTIDNAGQFYHVCQMHRQYWKSATDLDHERAEFQKTFNNKWRDDLVWEDMDIIYQMVGVEAFFDGHKPSSNYDVYRCQNAIEDILEGIKWIPRAKPTGLEGPIAMKPELGAKEQAYAKHTLFTYEPIAITHRLFFSKYAPIDDEYEEEEEEEEDYQNAAWRSWKLDTLQALLEEELKKEAFRLKRKKKLAGKGRKKMPSPQTSLLGADGDVSHVNILRALKGSLQRESRALHFDMLSFHTTCYRLLNYMREELRYVMEEVRLRSGRFEEDSMMLTILLYLPIQLSTKSFDDEFWYHDAYIILMAADMLSLVNANPRRRNKKEYLRLCGPLKDYPHFTNTGHLAIDDCIKRFLEKQGCKNSEVKKIEATLSKSS